MCKKNFTFSGKKMSYPHGTDVCPLERLGTDVCLLGTDVCLLCV